MNKPIETILIFIIAVACIVIWYKAKTWLDFNSYIHAWSIEDGIIRSIK